MSSRDRNSDPDEGEDRSRCSHIPAADRQHLPSGRTREGNDQDLGLTDRARASPRDDDQRVVSGERYEIVDRPHQQFFEQRQDRRAPDARLEGVDGRDVADDVGVGRRATTGTRSGVWLNMDDSTRPYAEYFGKDSVGTCGIENGELMS